MTVLFSRLDQKPLISVIVPAFNREGTLAGTATSVLTQTYRNIELIITDDHSTDRTRDVAEELSRTDTRIRVLQNNRTKGASGARNTGLYAARGQWVVFLDSDDCLEPQMIDTLLVRASTGDVEVVTCHSRLTEQQDDRQIQTGQFCWMARGDIRSSILSGEVYIDMNAALIRREALLLISGLDEDCPSYQEWDLHIRLCQSCRYDCIPELLVSYRQHAGQMSKDALRCVQGLLHVYRNHKRLWKTQKLTANWKQRMLTVFQDIRGLDRQRKNCLLELLQIEPRLIRWLPQRFLTRLAAGLTRRMRRPAGISATADETHDVST